MEVFGSIGQTDVVCSRFDTRKVGRAAVGSASSGRAVDSTFPAWTVHFQFTYVPAFQENLCNLQYRCLGIFL